MASTYLERNMTGNTASTKMTFSCWLKKSNPATDGRVFGAQALACHAYWLSSGELRVDFSQKDSGSTVAALKTNRKFRDTNAWYHIVFALDTTLGTADDRIKLWVNGVQETSFAVRTNASQNATYAYGQSGYYTVGARTSNQGGAGHYFDGLMSHVHYCDGYAYAASDFGSTDSTTGEWKINTSPSVSYGTNGFFLLKDNNSANDQSGNSNNFTASGTLTKSEDNPSNVFATWNPLVNPWSGATTWTYGNTRAYNSDSSKGSVVTTLGATSGKYYMEVKQENANGVWIGVCGDGFVSDNLLNSYSGQTQDATTGLLIKYSDGTRAVNNTDTNSVFATTGSGDITGIALDLDATTKTVTFYKNGVADSAGSQNLPTNMQTGAVFGCAIVFSGSAVNLNAGNGYFANNAISSEGTNASGIGKFEYDVPANHTALSTKGLNE